MGDAEEMDGGPWTAEEIATVDCALKMGRDPHEVALAIDRMFFYHDEADVIPHLRAAGVALTKAKDGLRQEIPKELHRKWIVALGMQMRASVTKAKDMPKEGEENS